MPSGGDGLYGIVRKKLPEDQLQDYDELIDRILGYDKIFEKSEQDLVDETMEFVKYFNLATGDSLEGNPNTIGGWTQHGMFMSMGA